MENVFDDKDVRPLALGHMKNILRDTKEDFAPLSEFRDLWKT